MDRTFHSKVDWWYWLLMAVTAFLLFDFFWFHYIIATLLVAAVMIFEIEMLIHTRYIVTGSGKLLIETGRFVADKTILLNTIVGMCKVNSFSIAPALSVHRVEITYRVGDKHEKVFVSPQNAEDFIRWVQKKMKSGENTDMIDN